MSNCKFCQRPTLPKIMIDKDELLQKLKLD